MLPYSDPVFTRAASLVSVGLRPRTCLLRPTLLLLLHEPVILIGVVLLIDHLAAQAVACNRVPTLNLLSNILLAYNA